MSEPSSANDETTGENFPALYSGEAHSFASARLAMLVSAEQIQIQARV